MKVFLNDRLVDEAEAVVSVYDHGFLYGDGIYETMRAYDGVVFLMDRHLQRLRRSAGLIGLNLPADTFMRDAIAGTVSANGLREAYVRVTVSRGKGAIGLDPALCPSITFVVFAEPFRPYPDALYREGVRLVFAATRRNLKEALDPRIKSLNFLNNILAKIEAKQRGAYEAVMLNAGGHIAEGTVSNIFFVRNGILCTPAEDAGVLDGITRETVIGLARQQGISVEEGHFLPEELLSATEVFFTNTTSEVMPVSRVEDVSFSVGPLSHQLREAYQATVRAYLKTTST